MKRFLSLLIVAVLILGVLCGCGGNGDNGGKVNLVWALPLAEQSDTDEVLEGVNKLLAEKLPNTTLELMLDSSMGTKWSLWMAGKKPIDIASSGYVNDLASEINKKSYVELNDLIEEYAPTIKKEWEKYSIDYATGMVNGKLYAIPDLQIHINDEMFFSVPEYYYQYLDVAALQKAVKENLTTTEVFYQIIDDYLAKASKVPNARNAGLMSYVEHFFRCFAKRGYEFVGGTSSLFCYRKDDETCKIVNFYETEEYLTYIKYAARWYEKGYISKDILTGEDGIGDKEALCTANQTNFRKVDANDDGIITPDEQNADGISKTNQYKISLTTDDQKYVGSSVLGSLSVYLSIPTTSKNPERAIQLLELLRTEEGKDILNMLVYGFEGKHYEVIGDNHIDAFEYAGQATSSNSYGIPNWIMGNQLNMYVCSPYSQITYDAAVEYYDVERPNYKRTKLFGYSFSNDAVKNQLSQLSAVNEEFMLQLIGGTSKADYMTTYNQMMSKLKAAGTEKVIADYQKQADDYIK